LRKNHSGMETFEADARCQRLSVVA